MNNEPSSSDAVVNAAPDKPAKEPVVNDNAYVTFAYNIDLPWGGTAKYDFRMPMSDELRPETDALQLPVTDENAWIQTYSGGKFFPLNPAPDSVRLADIIGSLSNTCRFNGHCHPFYSVLEHSVHVARQLSYKYRFYAFLHDASEGYFIDVLSPYKKYLAQHRRVEDAIQAAIYKKYGLERFVKDEDLNAKILEIDLRMLTTEKHQVMLPTQPWPKLDELKYPAYDLRLDLLPPSAALVAYANEIHKWAAFAGVK